MHAPCSIDNSRKAKSWEQRPRTEAAGMEREKGRGAHWLRGRVSGEWKGVEKL